ncbi:methyltransferase family protein, partial [Bacteroidota bacterium]
LNNYSNDTLSWISVLVIFLGLLILIIAFLSLGRYTKFGLPSEKTELITKGIYKLSRHPMYLGLFLLTIGSALYLSHWLIIVLSLETIFLHHKIVIAEEEFLALSFKEKWDEYKNKVNRYI